MEQFSADVVSEDVVIKITEQTEFHLSLGINATPPSLFINGYPWQQSWYASTLGLVVDTMKAEAKLSFECPPFVIDPEKNVHRHDGN